MRVSLYVGATEYVLAHGSTRGVDLHVGPGDDARGNLRALAQVDPIIGAANVSIQDRGNRSGRFSFSVDVEKASIEAAMLYCLTYPANLPRFGTLRFVEGTTTVNLATAHIEDVSYVQRGVSVTFTYQIQHGAAS
jgi:hypothetical protein